MDRRKLRVGLSRSKPSPQLLHSFNRQDIYEVPVTPEKTAKPLNDPRKTTRATLNIGVASDGLRDTTEQQAAREEREVIVASDATDHEQDPNSPSDGGSANATSSPKPRQAAKRQLPGDNVPRKRRQTWDVQQYGSRRRNEEAEEVEAAEDMTDRSNSYIPEIHFRSSPRNRHSRVTRNTYGKKRYGKMATLRTTELEDTQENTRHDNSPSAATSAASNNSSGTATAALVGTAPTASPVTATVANKRKPASGLQDTLPGTTNRTRRGATTDSQDMRLEDSAREDDAQTRRFRTPLQNRTESNETQNDATFANIEAGAATASLTIKAQTRRKHVQTRLQNIAEGSIEARFKTTKNSSPAPQGQPHIYLAASLHKECKVQDIKNFLSKVSDTWRKTLVALPYTYFILIQA